MGREDICKRRREGRPPPLLCGLISRELSGAAAPPLHAGDAAVAPGARGGAPRPLAVAGEALGPKGCGEGPLLDGVEGGECGAGDKRADRGGRVMEIAATAWRSVWLARVI